MSEGGFGFHGNSPKQSPRRSRRPSLRIISPRRSSPSRSPPPRQSPSNQPRPQRRLYQQDPRLVRLRSPSSPPPLPKQLQHRPTTVDLRQLKQMKWEILQKVQTRQTQQPAPKQHEQQRDETQLPASTQLSPPPQQPQQLRSPWLSAFLPTFLKSEPQSELNPESKPDQDAEKSEPSIENKEKEALSQPAQSVNYPIIQPTMEDVKKYVDARINAERALFRRELAQQRQFVLTQLRDNHNAIPPTTTEETETN